MTAYSFYSKQALIDIIFSLSIISVIRMLLYIYHEKEADLVRSRDINGNRICDNKYDDS